MMFTYEHDWYSLEMYWMCKYKLSTSSYCLTDIHTDRQKDVTKIIYHAVSWVVKKVYPLTAFINDN